jgi:hypothetical protein
MKSYKGRIEDIPYPGHKSFLEAENKWKTYLVQEFFNFRNGRLCGMSEIPCEVSSSIDAENDQW